MLVKFQQDVESEVPYIGLSPELMSELETEYGPFSENLKVRLRLYRNTAIPLALAQEITRGNNVQGQRGSDLGSEHNRLRSKKASGEDGPSD